MSSTAALGNDVRVAGRFVQWELIGTGSTITSSPFVIGPLPWQLLMQRNYDGQNCVSLVSLAPPPVFGMERVASISFECSSCESNGSPYGSLVHQPRLDVPLDRGCYRGYIWNVGDFASARIEIKFIDVKMGTDGPSISGWPFLQLKTMLQTGAQSAFAQMLNDGILTDIVVNAIGGSIRAHRAVLAAHSAVFRCMFSHDLREKEQSAVDISDMSSDGCQALISYLYGTLSEEEFLAHRSELLFAGDKYGIAGLKETCEKSLIDDVDTDNVLERLQMAHLYGLSALKRTCMTMLVEFKRVHRIPEDFREFARTGDGDLVAEVMESCRRQGYLPPWYDLASAGRVRNQLVLVPKKEDDPA